MITIKNTQRKISVNVKQLEKDAQTILRILHYEKYDLGIWLTNNKTIRSYNRTYRNKDKATDILSFSYHAELKPGEKIKPHTQEDYNLGDLIISVEYVQKTAQELNVTVYARLQVLLVHGICHLLGYDHERDEDYRVMHRKELALLKQLKK